MGGGGGGGGGGGAIAPRHPNASFLGPASRPTHLASCTLEFVLASRVNRSVSAFNIASTWAFKAET